jgi:hypothetical protein
MRNTRFSEIDLVLQRPGPDEEKRWLTLSLAHGQAKLRVWLM